MSEFEIRGTFRIGKAWQSFTKVLESNNEKNAIEKAYSLLGSEQRVKRSFVRIDEVKSLG